MSAGKADEAFDWRRGIGYAALLKAILLAVTLATAWANSEVHEVRFRKLWVQWPPGKKPDALSVFTAYDSAHYLFIAKEGYSASPYSAAFYPLWPALIRAGVWLFGDSSSSKAYVVSSLVLANALSFLGLVLFYRVVVDWRQREVSQNSAVELPGKDNGSAQNIAKASLLMLAFYPGALFFQFPYSESLFFCLLMGLMRGLQTGRHTLIWACGCMLPLVRGPGVFCFLPLVWRFFDRRNLSWHVLASVPLGWLSYFAVMRMATGDAFAGFEAQKYWGVHSMANLADVPGFIAAFFQTMHWHEFKSSILDRVLFITGLSLLPSLWRLNREWVVWSLALGLLPAMSGQFVSLTRYGAVVFPIFVAAGIFLQSFPSKAPLWIVVFLFWIVQILLLIRLTTYQWAG